MYSQDSCQGIMYRVGQNHIYIRCIYGIFSREIANHTVYIRCKYTVLANVNHVCIWVLASSFPAGGLHELRRFRTSKAGVRHVERLNWETCLANYQCVPLTKKHKACFVARGTQEN